MEVPTNHHYTASLNTVLSEHRWDATMLEATYIHAGLPSKTEEDIQSPLLSAIQVHTDKGGEHYQY